MGRKCALVDLAEERQTMGMIVCVCVCAVCAVCASFILCTCHSLLWICSTSVRSGEASKHLVMEAKSTANISDLCCFIAYEFGCECDWVSVS